MTEGKITAREGAEFQPGFRDGFSTKETPIDPEMMGVGVDRSDGLELHNNFLPGECFHIQEKSFSEGVKTGEIRRTDGSVVYFWA